MAQNGPVVDQREQFQKIEATLLHRKHVLGVFEMRGGGKGFLGVTSMRVIVSDKAVARKTKSMVSIPCGRIVPIAAEDEREMLTGRGFFASSKMELRAGSESFEFAFRGADRARMAMT